MEELVAKDLNLLVPLDFDDGQSDSSGAESEPEEDLKAAWAARRTAAGQDQSYKDLVRVAFFHRLC